MKFLNLHRPAQSAGLPQQLRCSPSPSLPRRGDNFVAAPPLRSATKLLGEGLQRSCLPFGEGCNEVAEEGKGRCRFQLFYLLIYSCFLLVAL